MVGDVKDDGASGRSGSLTQKVRNQVWWKVQWERVMCSAGGGVLVEMEETQWWWRRRGGGAVAEEMHATAGVVRERV